MGRRPAGARPGSSGWGWRGSPGPVPVGEGLPSPHSQDPSATQRRGRAAAKGPRVPSRGRSGVPVLPRSPLLARTHCGEEVDSLQGHRFKTSLCIFLFLLLCCGGGAGSAKLQSPNEFGKASNSGVNGVAVKVKKKNIKKGKINHGEGFFGGDSMIPKGQWYHFDVDYVAALVSSLLPSPPSVVCEDCI